jgi:hypothetical protein
LRAELRIASGIRREQNSIKSGQSDRPIALSLPRCILWFTESIWSRLNHVSGLGYLILTVTGGVAQSVRTLSALIKHERWAGVD